MEMPGTAFKRLSVLLSSSIAITKIWTKIEKTTSRKSVTGLFGPLSHFFAASEIAH
jgi:hypothetical protein